MRVSIITAASLVSVALAHAGEHGGTQKPMVGPDADWMTIHMAGKNPRNLHYHHQAWNRSRARDPREHD